ncbi:MAG: hypothetical protein AAGD09_21675 [Cyanobacteria bacterium P01_F01_bin.56]
MTLASSDYQWVGVDVSKGALDVYDLDSQRLSRYPNHEAGWFHTKKEKIIENWFAQTLKAWGTVRQPCRRAKVMAKELKMPQVTGA